MVSPYVGYSTAKSTPISSSRSVEQPGQHHRGAVERVAGGDAPHRDREHAVLAARITGRDRGACGAGHRQPIDALGHLLARLLDDEVTDEWEVLDEVTVAVDHRVVEPRADRGARVCRGRGGHHAQSCALSAQRPTAVPARTHVASGP